MSSKAVILVCDANLEIGNERQKRHPNEQLAKQNLKLKSQTYSMLKIEIEMNASFLVFNNGFYAILPDY